MKVYELIVELAKYPAGKDIIISHGEKSFIPYEAHDSNLEDMQAAVIIFARVDK